MATQNAHDSGSWFSRFTASSAGRVARIALGATLAVAGIFALPLPAGFVLAGVGLLLVAAGVFDFCPIAPLWGGRFMGATYCRATATAVSLPSATLGESRER